MRQGDTSCNEAPHQSVRSPPAILHAFSHFLKTRCRNTILPLYFPHSPSGRWHFPGIITKPRKDFYLSSTSHSQPWPGIQVSFVPVLLINTSYSRRVQSTDRLFWVLLLHPGILHPKGTLSGLRPHPQNPSCRVT